MNNFKIRKSLAPVVGFLLLAGLIITPVSAKERYEEKFDKTVSMSKSGKVIIRNISGDIEVKTWDRGEVKISAVKMSSTDSQEQAQKNFDNVEIVITDEGDNVKIETKYAKNYFRGKNKNCSVAYFLTIPSGADLNANSISGDIEVEQIGGEVRAESVSGDIVLLEIKGFVKGKSTSGDVKVTGASEGVDAHSISGNIIVKGVEGDTDMESVSGNIIASKIRGSVDANTVSGDIELREISRASRVKGKTLSGSVEYFGDIEKGGNYSLQSHSGEILMEIPSKAAFDLEAKSFSGSLNTEFELTVTGKLSRRSLSGTINGGGADVVLKTFSGSVHLRKR